MTTTYTDTFNRNDIQRVYASFAADYRIVAEFTGLHRPADINELIGQIRWLTEEQYLSQIHLQHKSSTGTIRNAAVYYVSTDASGWSSDRPGNLYWQSYAGDQLDIHVFYSKAWLALPESTRSLLMARHLPGWTASNFDGSYGTMSSSSDRRYASRAYGMERKVYSL